MQNSTVTLSNLFRNHQLQDEAWRDDVTGELSRYLIMATELEELPVPDNCDACREVHIELAKISGHANEAKVNWFKWLENPSEASYLRIYGFHVKEIGDVVYRIIAIMKSYNE